MLGKLIKYDIKSLNRFLIIIHAFLLLFAVLIRLFITGRISENTFSNTSDDTFFLFVFLAITVGTIAITAISLATSLLIAVRFYRNMFSDEAYLTHTLPVTRGQHLLAKTISGSIWGCIDVLLISASLYIIIATPYIKGLIRDNEAEILSDMGCTGAYAGITITRILMIYLGTCLINVIGNVITYYASVTLGQLFSNHRVVGAIVSYFGISTVVSIIACITLMVFGLLRFDMADTSFSEISYLLTTLKISLVLGVVTSVILYIITYRLISRKVNLN